MKLFISFCSCVILLTVLANADDAASSVYGSDPTEATEDDGAYVESTRDADSTAAPPETDGAAYAKEDDFDTFYSARSMAGLSKRDQIARLEDLADEIVRSEVMPASSRLMRATATYNAVKQSQPWFASSADKARLDAARREMDRAAVVLQQAQSREVAVRSRIKPLYGIISYPFMKEQRDSIVNSVKKVSSMAYDQAWWSSLFNARRADSLQDLVIGFFVQYFVMYTFMYPFAILYYAFVTAPYSIYEYSNGAADTVTAVVMWVAWVGIMCLPLVAIYYLFKMVVRHRPEHARHMPF